MPREAGLEVVNDGKLIGLCVTKMEGGFSRGKSVEVIGLDKAEALALAAELTLHARRVLA